MAENVKEQELLEDDEDVELEDEDLEDDGDGHEPAAVPAAQAEPGESVEEPAGLLLAKRAPEEAKPGEEEEDESMLSLEREERVESLAVKVVPQQSTEFVYKNCFLVKHRSQLADKRRTFCRDCA